MLISFKVFFGGSKTLAVDRLSAFLFVKMGHSRHLFLFFSSFQYSWQRTIFNKILSLPMTGFKPRTSGALLLNTEKRKNPFFHLSSFRMKSNLIGSASLSSKPNLEIDIHYLIKFSKKHPEIRSDQPRFWNGQKSIKVHSRMCEVPLIGRRFSDLFQ